MFYSWVCIFGPIGKSDANKSMFWQVANTTIVHIRYVIRGIATALITASPAPCSNGCKSWFKSWLRHLDYRTFRFVLRSNKLPWTSWDEMVLPWSLFRRSR